MLIIPVPAIEQHGPQLPIGTDYFSGEELAKLIAQKSDVLVAPVLLPGISPSPFHGAADFLVYRELTRPRVSCSGDGFLIFRTLRFHCCDLRLVTTALNLETSVMSRPVNTIVLPLGRSTPGR